jgi:hypothetical protein
MTATTAPTIPQHRRFGPRFAVRAYDLGPRCDTFLVVAIASVLGNRLFLIITGYPQVGNGTLHISHAIWGALMLAAAVIMSISFLGPFTRKVVAVLGGAGFGWFIDELGKFITRDVNYFFEPTFALIYMTFIALFLVFRALQRRTFRTDEGLLNALEAVKAAALGQLDEASRRRALSGLDATDESTGFAADVRTLLANAPSVPDRKESAATRATREMRRHYLALTARPGFVLVLDVFFTILAVVAVITVVGLAFDGPGVVTFNEWASLISSMIANACIIVGVVLVRRHERMRAYQWFDRGLLITIFVTQVFVFAEEQLGGTVGLVITLVVWVLLRGAMRAESDRQEIDELEREGAPT